MQLRIVGILTLLSALATGCTQLREPDFEPAEPNVKIVTYNVYWECSRTEDALAYLRANPVDIVLLQETHKRWERVLKPHLSHLYPHSAFEDWPRVGGGIAFLSRYPLTEVQLIQPAGGWFPALLARVDTPIGTVQLLNVHLKPAITERGNIGIKAYTTAGRIHLGELQGFLSAADPNLPLIIAGDFNENEKGKSIRWLTEQGFDNALWNFDRKSKTWTKPLIPLLTLKNRYDHIMLSPRLKCTGARVDRVRASDHMPVAAVIVKRRKPVP